MTDESHNLIAEFIRAHPDRTWQEVARACLRSEYVHNQPRSQGSRVRVGPAGTNRAAIASRVNHGGDERSEPMSIDDNVLEDAIWE